MQQWHNCTPRRHSVEHRCPPSAQLEVMALFVLSHAPFRQWCGDATQMHFQTAALGFCHFSDLCLSASLFRPPACDLEINLSMQSLKTSNSQNAPEGERRLPGGALSKNTQVYPLRKSFHLFIYFLTEWRRLQISHLLYLTFGIIVGSFHKCYCRWAFLKFLLR